MKLIRTALERVVLPPNQRIHGSLAAAPPPSPSTKQLEAPSPGALSIDKNDAAEAPRPDLEP